ncbi:hypothetical protein CDAR_199511 [Caerostris darwini]|uniref:Uncharacterized protein n=1 Tax=Caerostris darwini TaxID=1538125 RepID=A0AAV4MD46_9ARAC|nr:hypothetical protein CDAR_199511 [Caerostris darwini]
MKQMEMEKAIEISVRSDEETAKRVWGREGEKSTIKQAVSKTVGVKQFSGALTIANCSKLRVKDVMLHGKKQNLLCGVLKKGCSIWIFFFKYVGSQVNKQQVL